MATKYRILVKEVWDRPDADELNTCWVEVFDTLRKAQNQVKRINSRDRWDCVGDWKRVVEDPIEVYQTA